MGVPGEVLGTGRVVYMGRNLGAWRVVRRGVLEGFCGGVFVVCILQTFKVDFEVSVEIDLVLANL